ncbi:acyltransferase [Microbacterium aerolatum]|uniref:acyltransferase family protein n=1 Tax=Microbacterium aerolatum TaxID=153731 RepID=UPI0020017053|nr:acyltransferase [Microbacterium aerolatum]MCK3770210.1 acyltransferase [Microbacterium aerolatum]
MNDARSPLVPAGRSPGHQRLVALDGLRGAAAAVVVLAHALLVSTYADAYVERLNGAETRSFLVRLLADTPLHHLVMSTEAVIIFFVLSGMVLTLPLLRGKSLDLWSYYPRRILRLWIPAASAMLFAIAVILVTGQDPADATSQWTRTFSFPALTAKDILDSFLLITGSPKLNNPLWSLKWEMLFSLLLPIGVLLVVRLRRFLWAAVILCGVVSGIGTTIGSLAVKYLPMFLVGCIIARIIVARGPVQRASANVAILLVGVLALGLPNTLRVVLPAPLPYPASSLIQGAVLIGAAMIVYSLVGPSIAASLLSSAPFRFLGRISFGVYLVHVPILLGGLHVVPDFPNRMLALTIPLSFVVGWLFTRFVEEPSASLARRAGRWAFRARARLSPPTPVAAPEHPGGPTVPVEDFSGT